MVQECRVVLPVSRTGKITLFYNLAVALFVILFKEKVEGFSSHLLFNGTVILIVIIVETTSWKNRLGRICALWYPMILFTFFYYQTGLLNRILIPEFMDSFFMGLDRKILGYFPFPFPPSWYKSVFVNEYFHLSYLSYYLLVPLAGLLIYRKEKDLFKDYIFQISALFYLCYLIYIIIPVEGPIHLREGIFGGNGFFQKLVEYIYLMGENPGAAFPSSHVAVGLFAAWWGSRQMKRGKYLFWIPALSLTVATLYCMFHYFIDVIGGVALALIFMGFSHTLVSEVEYEKAFCSNPGKPGGQNS